MPRDPARGIPLGAVVGTAAVAAIALSTIAIIGDPRRGSTSGTSSSRPARSWVAAATSTPQRGPAPRRQDIHSYLPWMTVLVAPGKWLFGDVRWALLLWSLVLLLATVALARLSATDGLGNRRGAAIAALPWSSCRARSPRSTRPGPSHCSPP